MTMNYDKENKHADIQRGSWASKVDPHGNWTRPVPMLDPWLSTSDTSWIDPIYAECFSKVFQSRRRGKQETTFQVIVANLAKAETQICCPVDKRSWDAVDPRPANFGVTLIRECVDALEEHGYLTSWRAFSSSKAKQQVTYISPTERLLGRSPMSMKYQVNEDGIIRCKGFKRPEDYLGNIWVSQRYHMLRDYNLMMQDTPENQLYAVYKNDFQSMGRFAGCRVMMMRKEDRRAMIVDGEKLFEADIEACHPSILLAKTQGIRLAHDFYDVDEIPRGLVKVASMMALNCKSRKKAQQALQGWVNEGRENRLLYKGYNLALIFDTLERKTPHWRDLLYQNRGLELMADESLRMSLFLEDMVTEGIKVYPIHDSVMGKVSDKEIIIERLTEHFTIKGVELTVKIKGE